MASETPIGHLEVRSNLLLQRQTNAAAEGTSRSMTFMCDVTRWVVFGPDDTEKLNGISFDKGDILHVNIRERRVGPPLWKDHPEKIGTVGALGGEQMMRATIYVRPEAFGSFWAKAEAPHNFSSTISLELVANPVNPALSNLSVISVGFYEDGPKPELHPVVAEIRDVRESVWRQLKSVSNWLLFVVVVLLVLSGWLLKR